MSRTFKDRPYWVKTNDPKNLEVITYHHHVHFGRPLWKTVPVRDAEGNLVTTEETVKHYHTGEPYIVTRGVYENRLVGYTSKECDAHEPEDGTHYSESLRNCGHYLRLLNPGRRTRDDKTEKHRSSRARQRDLLKNITKTGALEDEDEVFMAQENMTETWARRY